MLSLINPGLQAIRNTDATFNIVAYESNQSRPASNPQHVFQERFAGDGV